MQTVTQFWSRRDLRGTLSALKRAADPSVTLDVLQAYSSAQSSACQSSTLKPQSRDGLLASIQLEHCREAISLLIPLLVSCHAQSVEIGLNALASLVISFAEVSTQGWYPVNLLKLVKLEQEIKPLRTSSKILTPSEFWMVCCF